ncbi:tRNA ribose methylase [Cryptosporidium canis]|nr:tRNA ribose methylase [Cryptosporidium canis]
MKEQIKNLVEVLEKTEGSYTSLLDALDILLKVQYEECINKSGRELYDVILRLLRETDYTSSEKKFLLYIYILKFISERMKLSLKELMLEDFISNFYKIECNTTNYQIHELIFNSLSSDISEFYLILDKWKIYFTEFLKDKEDFESLTNLIFFICNKLHKSLDFRHQLNIINLNIIQAFSEIYEGDRSKFLFDQFISKLEYSQNALFPYFTDSEVGKQAHRLFKNIVELIESNLNIKVFAFTLRIPNLIETFTSNGFYLNYNKIIPSFVQGLLSKDSEIRKSTRFILEKLEEQFNSQDTVNYNQKLNHVKSFLCILDCYENFSIHLLKTNWDKFDKLLSELQNSKREWWIDCLIEIGLSHENLNVQRFVAFNTMNFATKDPKNLPSWMKHDIFFEIYLKYIVSSLNNKISLQIEELFLKLIYSVLKSRPEWTGEYLEYIIHNIKAFTPIRVLIYPLSIGINNICSINHPNNLSADSKVYEQMGYPQNYDLYIKTKTSKDITQKYSFEYNSEFKEFIVIPRELFKKALDLSIPIIKYIPILLRRDVYSTFVEIILNYFSCHKFSTEELINNLIIFLGIIPEYLYYTNRINMAICNHILNYRLLIDSTFEPEKLANSHIKWFDTIHLGIGFGRLKKIVGTSSNLNLILKNHAIFISCYYNHDDIRHLNDEIHEKIIDIFKKIKVLFENGEEGCSIDIDLLWLDLHILSLINCDSYNCSLKALWDWCISVISNIDHLLVRIKTDINSQISLAMILKCLMHLQCHKRFNSTNQCIEVINNLFLINSNMLSKMLVNNLNLTTWYQIRGRNSLYDVFDVHSINNDKYCIIQSSIITVGFPEKCPARNEIIGENRITQLFPANYRDLFNVITQLKFQLINIFISKNMDSISNVLISDVYQKELFLYRIDSDNSCIKGTYLDWFKHIISILICEIDNSGIDNLYIWLLLEQLFGLISCINEEKYRENFISEFLHKIFALIIKNCDELIDHGIYRSYLFKIFNLILTRKEYALLFEKHNLITEVAMHFYNKIISNCDDVRLFVFPLLDLIKYYVEQCSCSTIEGNIEDIEGNAPLRSEQFNTIIIFANILVELIVFEEHGLLDASKVRFQEFSEDTNIGVQEMIKIYKRCKIYEDNNSFIRHVTIIYLSNIIDDSMINKNDQLIQFISLVVTLLTQKLECTIPKCVENKLSIANMDSVKDSSYFSDIYLISKTDHFKNAKKFPPLPNSDHHKIMINIWQSLCCFVNLLNLCEQKFNSYFIEFYFKHIQYLYTPDIRQYIDMLGCNIITTFPRKCVKLIKEGLSNNINNHTQIIYSYLCISSYLIHFLKEITPFPLNDTTTEFEEKLGDIFFYEGERWIKFNEEFLDDYISFFNLFVSYSISNSSLIRSIVLFTLFSAYNSNNIFEHLGVFSENGLFSKMNESDSLTTTLKTSFQAHSMDEKVELIRNSKFYLSNRASSSDKVFLINIFILENSAYITKIVYSIFNNKDLLKMMKSISFAWAIWKPNKQCSAESIIPKDNLVEFSDQKASQAFFSCSSCLDSILCKLDGSTLIDEIDIERELLAMQDMYDSYILDSHLVFGDLRPSWSLYYLLKKVICREMSEYYVHYTDEKDESKEIEIRSSCNYQLKFEPPHRSNQISCRHESKRSVHRSIDRTGLVVIGSLLDKIPNMAGLTRTCEIFRVHELLLSNKKVMNDPIFKQISVTAEKWLPVNELESSKIKEYVHKKRQEGYKIFGLEQTSSSIPLHDCTFPNKSLLILGKEKEGIPSDIVSIVDQCVEIPQYGVIRSLNVHVSASIFIYEYTTQLMGSRKI